MLQQINMLEFIRLRAGNSFHSLSSSCIMESLVFVSSSSNIIGVFEFSADNFTAKPSEQKLRSGLSTRVGELDRESRGDKDSMLGREQMLEVIVSRALTGDPVKEVIEASSQFKDDIWAGDGIGTPESVVVDAAVVVARVFVGVVTVVDVKMVEEDCFCTEDVPDLLTIESADFPRADGGELCGVEELLKFLNAGSVTFSMNRSSCLSESEQWRVSRGLMDGMPSPQMSSFSLSDAAVT